MLTVHVVILQSDLLLTSVRYYIVFNFHYFSTIKHRLYVAYKKALLDINSSNLYATHSI